MSDIFAIKIKGARYIRGTRVLQQSPHLRATSVVLLCRSSDVARLPMLPVFSHAAYVKRGNVTERAEL